MAGDRTMQCEHINRELWLYIATDLILQCELELDNIYKIVQCMPSFRADGLIYNAKQKDPARANVPNFKKNSLFEGCSVRELRGFLETHVHLELYDRGHLISPQYGDLIIKPCLKMFHYSP